MYDKDNTIIILFNGYASSKKWYEYAFDPTNTEPIFQKIDFLKQLKKIAKTYTFNQSFFAIDSYYKSDNKKQKIYWEKLYNEYKPFSSNINFVLEDLDYKNICNKVYNSVKNKYGNNKKYIIIGHSYGGAIGLLFSKLYKNECILCCCIDNPPHLLSFYNKQNDKINKNILEKYTDNNKLKESLSIIKNSDDQKEKNKEIKDVFKLIWHKSCQDRIKYYDDKLYTPTIFFKAYYTSPKKNDIDVNKNCKKEQKFFKNHKNLQGYIIMNNANHYIWNNQDFSDIIIDTIKESLD